VSALEIGGIHAGGSAAGGLSFELQGALALSRNLGILARDIGKFEQRAIGTLKRKVGTEARRDIQREYNIKAGRLSKDLRVSTPSDGIRITGYFRGIGLRNFSARQTKAGVTAGVFKAKRTLREGAFFAPLLGGVDGGNKHVVRREGDKRVMTRGRYAGKQRQPIAVQYGPTAAQMLRKQGRPERLADFALGVLGAEMTRQVDGWLKARTSDTGATA
jgi:hypothetical protein